MTRSIYRPPWRIDLDVRDGVRSPLSGAALARAIGAALDAVAAPAPASIGLVLSDDAELATLNQEHMGHAGPTDVLSFPLEPTAGFALPPRTRPHLGDIVVSVERAIEQAATGRGGQTGDVRWSAGRRAAAPRHPRHPPYLRLGPCDSDRGGRDARRWKRRLLGIDVRP